MCVCHLWTLVRDRPAYLPRYAIDRQAIKRVDRRACPGISNSGPASLHRSSKCGYKPPSESAVDRHLARTTPRLYRSDDERTSGTTCRTTGVRRTKISARAQPYRSTNRRSDSRTCHLKTQSLTVRALRREGRIAVSCGSSLLGTSGRGCESELSKPELSTDCQPEEALIGTVPLQSHHIAARLLRRSRRGAL